ncbi:hypothetical protein JW949_03460 [Candidatus Woesearchaeota archaeon]|nr:hypothetical protein [Candidatus Woesearchaeota archaeon]
MSLSLSNKIEKLSFKAPDGCVLEGYRINNNSNNSLIFAKGLFSIGDYYKDFLQEIANKTQNNIGTLNYRAHGNSGGIYNEEKCFQDFNQFVNQYLSENNVSLMGYSIGCNYIIKILYELFSKNFDLFTKIDKIVLISPHYSVELTDGTIQKDLNWAKKGIDLVNWCNKTPLVNRLNINTKALTKSANLFFNIKDSIEFVSPIHPRKVRPEVYSLSDFVYVKGGARVYDMDNIYKQFTGGIQIKKLFEEDEGHFFRDFLKDTKKVISLFGRKDRNIGFNKHYNLFNITTELFSQIGEVKKYNLDHELSLEKYKKKNFKGKKKIIPHPFVLDDIVNFLLS